MSIFISIASFCDSVLFFTLEQAVKKAKYPNQLHFGIVDQSYLNSRHPAPADVFPARLTSITIDPSQARGPCWARNVAMSLYDNEDWFFQIDSHMDFKQDWDSYLVEQATELQK